ncbi:MAG: hypothetical protein PQJ59_17005 [Spirochaetales bacterium]|nr:hypothetical protein [Spirochaetales bacterium]
MRYVIRKSIKGGKADNLTPADLAEKYDIPLEEIRSRLEEGIKVEMEHTDKRSIAREIAMDHLSESAEYYSKLEEMEEELKTKKSIIEKVKYVFRKSKGEVKSGRIITRKELLNLANGQAEYDRNYNLQGRISWHGLNIAIENKKGSYRRGVDPYGKPWETYMNYDYGRIVGSKASDNEAVDVYIGPDDAAEYVYIVHQNDPFTGRYDEDKCMCGFPSKESAIEAYLSQYDRPDYLGEVSEMTIKDFKESLKEKYGEALYQSPILIKSRIISKKVDGKTKYYKVNGGVL